MLKLKYALLENILKEIRRSYPNEATILFAQSPHEGTKALRFVARSSW
jgi:hypothetical protein